MADFTRTLTPGFDPHEDVPRDCPPAKSGLYRWDRDHRETDNTLCREMWAGGQTKLPSM